MKPQLLDPRNESKAVYESLISLGFVLIRDKAIWVYHGQDGVINLPAAQSLHFTHAIQAIGHIYFNTRIGNAASRKMHFSMSQTLIDHCSIWEDAVLARLNMGLARSSAE